MFDPILFIATLLSVSLKRIKLSTRRLCGLYVVKSKTFEVKTGVETRVVLPDS